MKYQIPPRKPYAAWLRVCLITFYLISHPLKLLPLITVIFAPFSLFVDFIGLPMLSTEQEAWALFKERPFKYALLGLMLTICDYIPAEFMRRIGMSRLPMIDGLFDEILASLILFACFLPISFSLQWVFLNTVRPRTLHVGPKFRDIPDVLSLLGIRILFLGSIVFAILFVLAYGHILVLERVPWWLGLPVLKYELVLLLSLVWVPPLYLEHNLHHTPDRGTVLRQGKGLALWRAAWFSVKVTRKHFIGTIFWVALVMGAPLILDYFIPFSNLVLAPLYQLVYCVAFKHVCGMFPCDVAPIQHHRLEDTTNGGIHHVEEGTAHLTTSNTALSPSGSPHDSKRWDNITPPLLSTAELTGADISQPPSAPKGSPLEVPVPLNRTPASYPSSTSSTYIQIPPPSTSIINPPSITELPLNLPPSDVDQNQGHLQSLTTLSS